MGILIHTKIKLLEKGSSTPISDSSVLVKLYDRDLIEDDYLGEASPNHDGDVHIKFDLDKIKSADSPLEQFPDLYFRVYKNGTPYFQSRLMDDVDTSEGSFSFTEGKVIDLGTFLI